MAIKISDLTESLLALVVIGGVVAIAVYDSIVGRPVNIPPELYGFGGIVIGAYFRGRSVNGTINHLTDALAHSQPSTTSPPPAVP